MRIRRVIRPLLTVAAAAGLAAAGYLTQDAWRPWLEPARVGGSEPTAEAATGPPTGKVILTDQAVANLGLRAEPVKPEDYWKTVVVPGMVVDRPGRSDRGVIAP